MGRTVNHVPRSTTVPVRVPGGSRLYLIEYNSSPLFILIFLLYHLIEFIFSRIDIFSLNVNTIATLIPRVWISRVLYICFFNRHYIFQGKILVLRIASPSLAYFVCFHYIRSLLRIFIFLPVQVPTIILFLSVLLQSPFPWSLTIHI